jgi:hypothetical protein
VPSINHAANAGRHPLADRGLDLYETPPEATIALLKHEELPSPILEPCCGPGAITRVLRAAGHRVYGCDIHRYNDYQDGVGDFLTLPSTSFACIVTNPPYNQADKFVRHALKLCPHVCMLLRFAFFESERRTAILENAGLKTVYLFRKRLPMMHRHGWSGRHATSSIPFAWFVWHRHYRGLPEVHRISWVPMEKSDDHSTAEGGERRTSSKDHARAKKVHAAHGGPRRGAGTPPGRG